MEARDPLRPAALRPGDLVMLVSPSGPTTAERVVRGMEILTGWDLRVVLGPNAYSSSGYLAGEDADRLADVNLALSDPEVRGVVCTRGGYGVQRIADGVDGDAVRADPKVVVGFSDITALHLALWRAARLATVHGPAVGWLGHRSGPEAVESLRRCLMAAEPVVLKARETEETSEVRLNASAGPVTGPLLGGNLSLLSTSVGTPDMPDLRGAIVLLEEVDEPPYKVDRMLLHLRRAGCLDGVAGVVVGQFTNCADEWPIAIDAVLAHHLGGLGVPVLGGLPLGHGEEQLSVPLGVPATLDVTAGTLTAAPAVG